MLIAGTNKGCASFHSTFKVKQPKENLSQSVIVFSEGQHGLTHDCAGPLLALEGQRRIGRTWKGSCWDRLWKEMAVLKEVQCSECGEDSVVEI